MPPLFEVKIHRIATDGSAVLTERTDALIFGPLRLQFWVCGVFEVHDGQITLWRDYFDFFDMFKATLAGPGRVGRAVAQGVVLSDAHASRTRSSMSVTATAGGYPTRCATGYATI